jgi:hypothetical protein
MIQKFVRALARQCSELMTTAIKPEVIEQLRMWAVEFTDKSNQAQRHAANREKGRDRDQGCESATSRRE